MQALYSTHAEIRPRRRWRIWPDIALSVAFLKAAGRLQRSGRYHDPQPANRSPEAPQPSGEHVSSLQTKQEKFMSNTSGTTPNKNLAEVSKIPLANPNGIDPDAAQAKAKRVGKAKTRKAAEEGVSAAAIAAGMIGEAVPVTQPAPAPALTDAEKVKLKKARAKKAKDEKEARPPLPEGTKPAPEIPAQKVEAEITIEDIIADDSEDDDYAIEVPSGIQVRRNFPKADFVRIKPGVALVVNTIRLDEEDRKPNQLDVFVLLRGLKRYVVEQLNHNVTKMAVRIGVTLHGHAFFLMHPVSSELDGNRYNSTRAEAIIAAEGGWIKVRSDQAERCYKYSKRSPSLAPVEPIFPSDPFGAPDEPGGKNLFLRSLGTSLITNENHRVLKRLRGEEEEEIGEATEADE
jgi:hypothetical protein